VRTIFGAKHRPHHSRSGPAAIEAVIETSRYDLTWFKVTFGRLAVKAYTKDDMHARPLQLSARLVHSRQFRSVRSRDVHRRRLRRAPSTDHLRLHRHRHRHRSISAAGSPRRAVRCCASGWLSRSPAGPTWSSRSRPAPDGGSWSRNVSGPGSPCHWPSRPTPPRRGGRKRRAKTDPAADLRAAIADAGYTAVIKTQTGADRREGRVHHRPFHRRRAGPSGPSAPHVPTPIVHNLVMALCRVCRHRPLLSQRAERPKRRIDDPRA
jgi:hypothetical protein